MMSRPFGIVSSSWHEGHTGGLKGFAANRWNVCSGQLNGLAVEVGATHFIWRSNWHNALQCLYKARIKGVKSKSEAPSVEWPCLSSYNCLIKSPFHFLMQYWFCILCLSIYCWWDKMDLPGSLRVDELQWGEIRHKRVFALIKHSWVCRVWKDSARLFPHLSFRSVKGQRRLHTLRCFTH